MIEGWLLFVRREGFLRLHCRSRWIGLNDLWNLKLGPPLGFGMPVVLDKLFEVEFTGGGQAVRGFLSSEWGRALRALLEVDELLANY